MVSTLTHSETLPYLIIWWRSWCLLINQNVQDVGHSILEAYSRVLANLAFSILSRLGDILQEDIMSNPNSPVAMSHLVGARIPGISDSPMLDRVRHSLIHQLNGIDMKSCSSRETTDVSDIDGNHEEAKISSVSATPSRSRVWCIGREACHSLSASNSPWYNNLIIIIVV